MLNLFMCFEQKSDMNCQVSMRKKRLVLTAAALCGVFLFCQFLLHHLTAVASVSMVTCVDQMYIIVRLHQCVICLNSSALFGV